MMKKTFAVLLFTAATLAAQSKGATGATAPKAAPKTTTVQPVTIPADAIANPNGSYAWTDKQGKRWLFVKTPFGIMKSEAGSPPTDSKSLAGVKAFDSGDKVRFESASPFGILKWEKNKADLTDEERDLLNAQVSSETAGQNAKQD